MKTLLEFIDNKKVISDKYPLYVRYMVLSNNLVFVSLGKGNKALDLIHEFVKDVDQKYLNKIEDTMNKPEFENHELAISYCVNKDYPFYWDLIDPKTNDTRKHYPTTKLKYIGDLGDPANFNADYWKSHNYVNYPD